jgi:hypothetical protein
MGVVGSAVVANIEDLSVDGEPFEVALSCVCNLLVGGLPVKIWAANGQNRTLLCNETLSSSW